MFDTKGLGKYNSGGKGGGKVVVVRGRGGGTIVFTRTIAVGTVRAAFA